MSIAVIYGSTTGMTAEVAANIASALGAECLNVAEVFADTLAGFDALVLGSSTWGAGDLQDDWEANIGVLEGASLAGKKVAIVPILRAGLGMVDTIIDLIPSAKVGHIGLYRDPETHNPVEYYCKMPPDISEREVIIVDPMLATGGSAAAAISFIKGYGCKSIKLMNIIGCPEGIEVIQREHPDVDLYVAAVDERLNENKYIVPGLGDAGDRIFGTK